MEFESCRSNITDTVASSACTKSGAFALLLSLALVSLIPYWLEGREDSALGKYLALRLELATQIELLDDSGTWQTYKTAHPDAGSATMAHLVQATVLIPLAESGSSGAVERKEIVSSSKAVSSGVVPAPVTNLRAGIVSGIDEIRQAADFMMQLDDSNLLTISRSYSNFFDLSIYRWSFKRNAMVSRNETSAGPEGCLQAASKSPPRPSQSAHPETKYFVPEIGKDVLLGCMTLDDVRSLAEFELPKLPDTTRYSGRSGKEVEISPGSLPRDLYMASVFAGSLLLFVVIYFGAFLREAVSSATFPAPGTLFGAFSRSPWTSTVFAIAVWIPAASSVAVALASRRILLILCALLIMGAVLPIDLMLRRKSYFRGLSQLHK
jgi:hypothetical protein